ncbi:MAG: glycosyltransferase family 4 protein [Candidatus Saccharimonadales bacterium]
MKIGLICPYNIARGGGVQEVVRALQDGLNSRGHQAIIITPKPRQGYIDDGRAVAFLGTAKDFRSPTHTLATFSTIVENSEIDDLLEREKFDILNFHEPWVPMLSRQILYRSNTVNVVTFHAKLPDTMMSRTMSKAITPYTKPMLKHFQAFTAASDAAADYARSLIDEPIEIVLNGINLAGFKPVSRSVAAKNKTILYVGRLERRKGVKYLLKAMQLLQARQPDTKLWLVGDGPDRDKLQMQAKELGLNNVKFYGYVDEAEKIDLLAKADLFCAPAIFGESFGIVLLEAMASGLVTVAGDNPGYSSVMQGVGNLSLVDPKDTLEFARRLQLLLNVDELREVWQEWAAKYVKQFDYPKVVDNYEAVYKRALKTYGPK